MTDFSSSQYYFNRHLSWLEFNQRVLDEAKDKEHPLLERLRFLCIVSSNLDEFFEIRVAGLKQMILSSSTSQAEADGMLPQQVLEKIRDRVQAMTLEQYQVWHEAIEVELKSNGIQVFCWEELNDENKLWAESYFDREIFPILTPLAIAPSHPFPQLLNKSLNQIIVYRRKESDEVQYALIQVPRGLKQLISLPDNKNKHFLFLKHLINHFAYKLFDGVEIQGVYPFRITRNSELYIDEEEALDLLHSIEEELKNRNRGNAVRLEVRDDCPLAVQHYLLHQLELTEVDLYQSSDPVHFQLLAELCSLQEPLLKHPTFQPRHALHTQTQGAIFDAVKQKDILLHHPYDSFSTVVDFIDQAAVDPLTMAIKMTLYRTSGDSPIVKALIRAAQNEKPVTAIVELKARFDEANNIAWAKLMEEEGVHVVYGPVDMKTHCKMLMVVRREEEGIRHYVHLGTGNYHATTARLYTDVGLFTCNPLVTTEVAKLFNTLTGLSEFGHFEQLIVAPHQMHQRMLALIDGEIEHARQGRGGRIFLKLNALSEDKIISKLYEASCSGVRVDMVVRGICTLKPQLQGVSENIRVVSVVDRFLEHSRCYYFENGGDAKIYFGSADWMQRNFHKRVEVAFPILEPYWRDWVTKSLIPTYLKDNTKARVLGADGCYSKPLTNQDRHRAQAIFMP